MKDVKLLEALKFVFKYFVTFTFIITLLGGCYWEFYVKKKVEDKMAPLIIGIFEIKTILNKTVSVEIRNNVRKEVESFEKLLKKD